MAGDSAKLRHGRIRFEVLSDERIEVKVTQHTFGAPRWVGWAKTWAEALRLFDLKQFGDVHVIVTGETPRYV